MTITLRSLGRATPSAAVDWEAVYAQELPRIYNFFRYHLDDDALAEDLTAATFEKAWRARARYRHDIAAFSTWLFKIARNVAADHFRRSRAHTSLDDLHQLASDDRLEEATERNAEFTQVRALLGRLPNRERDLLALKYGADMNNREIARLTGLSESNVGTILHRALSALRAQLDGKL
ncbi:MAG: sigma-70 family RNA polymerase sigma factor [Chloroflexi bacterium]|nr:sigma-70 family RNA polymerase sigma factor [Chloroflexota bacterium]